MDSQKAQRRRVVIVSEARHFNNNKNTNEIAVLSAFSGASRNNGVGFFTRSSSLNHARFSKGISEGAEVRVRRVRLRVGSRER
jgi:hypothetical protein